MFIHVQTSGYTRIDMYIYIYTYTATYASTYTHISILFVYMDVCRHM